MGCTFCATGTMGIVRNLTAGEIVGQVLALMKWRGPATGHQLNLVFMGMGEPLHNLDAVLRAITVLCDPAGLGLPAMRISVSTAGLFPGIVRLAAVPTAVRPCLALSVNATTDSKRSLTMPITKRHGLAELRAALEVFPLRAHEKLTLEYVLLAGDNDSPEDAARLAAFAQGLRHVVNVIPWNGFAEGAFRAPDDDAVQTFARALMAAGCFVTVRKSRGRDVAGACGQLATEARRAPRRLLG